MDHDPIAGNRALWDELTPIHARSAFYDLEGFRTGRSSLYRIEREELGEEVASKRLLHLQCHFGLDTLSWARMGVEVTGVVLSPRSIELARAPADELTINAHFVCASLYELPPGPPTTVRPSVHLVRSRTSNAFDHQCTQRLVE